MTTHKQNTNDEKSQVEKPQASTTEESTPDVEITEGLQEPMAAEETEETTEMLQAEIERLRGQADEYLDGWQRARAEFANFKKRAEREKDEIRAQIMSELLIQYLDVLDDLERALRERPVEAEGKTWAEGIELIHLKLTAILEAEGVEPISAEGLIFNPNFHEAISYEEDDDHQDGQVIEIVQQGYQLGNRVLRPAKVRVAK